MTVPPSTQTLPTRVAAVLFDMDNTLVASEDAWFAAAHQLWREAGGDPRGKGVLGGTVQDVVDDYVRDFPGTDPSALADRVVAMLTANLSNGVHATPGAVALLERISTTLPITIASNSPSVIVQQVVAALGWERLFTAALGTEDVARPKPAPDLYTAAATRCGVDIVDCVVFEDSLIGATAARASGAFVVTIGPDAANLGDVNVADLTDPRITSWRPEVVS